MRIIPKLTWGRRRRLRRWYQRERNGIVRVRVLVVTQLAEGATSVDIERSGVCVCSTVSYVAERFRCLGELGLEDGRRFNGGSKLSEAVLSERSVIPVPGQQLGVTLRGTDEFLEDLVAASGHLGLEALLPAVGREVLHAGARL